MIQTTTYGKFKTNKTSHIHERSTKQHTIFTAKHTVFRKHNQIHNKQKAKKHPLSLQTNS